MYGVLPRVPRSPEPSSSLSRTLHGLLRGWARSALGGLCQAAAGTGRRAAEQGGSEAELPDVSQLPLVDCAVLSSSFLSILRSPS